ncbi:hypothetical protein HYH02_012694 [Chlamydomonas schloesseri]|uniref:Uncharacterized protein n=1 Tax=Chlamydomonas schloesseri TaxID=2026947 RepID=A0A835VZ05_9CHLO|nr:hypothetical protein HYH02_012694 [Chlamydomonas schloesseri]|eukprot:KAG2433150.1 hypothetical protein HYH02_012694 [Chlamydomonas schloesseri]
MRGTVLERNFAQQTGGGLAQALPAAAGSTRALAFAGSAEFATGAGSAAAGSGRLGAAPSGSLVLEAVSVMGNVVWGSGGGVHVATQSGVRATASSFVRNTADQQGGAFAAVQPVLGAMAGDADAAPSAGEDSAEIEFRSCSFEANRAGGGSGGAIYSSRSSGVAVHLHDSNFTSNRAAQSGGAVSVVPAAGDSAAAAAGAAADAAAGADAADADHKRGELLVEGCSLNANAASRFGGAISVAGGVAAIIQGSNLTENVAGQDGGGIAVLLMAGAAAGGAVAGQQPAAVVSSATDVGATATTAAAPLEVHRCRFKANQAAGSGGALAWAAPGRMSLTDSTFTANVAFEGSGGGVAALPPDHYVRSSALTSRSASVGKVPAALEVRRCQFDGNRASAHAGGLLVMLSFAEPANGRSGGAARSRASAFASAEVSECSFRNGVAGSSGGGLSVLCPEELCGSSDARRLQRRRLHGSEAAPAGVAWLRIHNVALLSNVVTGTAGFAAGGDAPVSSAATAAAAGTSSSSTGLARRGDTVAAGGGAAIDGVLRAALFNVTAVNNTVALPAAAAATLGSGSGGSSRGASSAASAADLGGGGGLYVGAGSAAAIDSCYFEGNVVVGSGSSPTGLPGGGGGGGILAAYCSALLLASTEVLGGSSIGAAGGGILTDGCCVVAALGGQVAQNAAAAGGGIYIRGGAAPEAAATIAGSWHAGHANGTLALLHGITISGNNAGVAAKGSSSSTASAATSSSSSTSTASYDGYGGGLMVAGSVVALVSRSDLSDSNIAASRGAAIASTQTCDADSSNHDTGSSGTSFSTAAGGDALASFVTGLLAWSAADTTATLAHEESDALGAMLRGMSAIARWRNGTTAGGSSGRNGCWPLLLSNSRIPYTAAAAKSTASNNAAGSGDWSAEAAATAEQARPAAALFPPPPPSQQQSATGGRANSSPGAAAAVPQLWMMDAYARAMWPSCDPVVMMPALPAGDAASSRGSSMYSMQLPSAADAGAFLQMLRAHGVPMSAALEAYVVGSAGTAAGGSWAGREAVGSNATAVLGLPRLLLDLAICRLPALPAADSGGGAEQLLSELLQPLLLEAVGRNSSSSGSDDYMRLSPASFRITAIRFYDPNLPPQQSTTASPASGDVASTNSDANDTAAARNNSATQGQLLPTAKDIGGLPEAYAGHWALTSGVKLQVQVELVNGLGVRVPEDDTWTVTAQLSIQPVRNATTAPASAPSGAMVLTPAPASGVAAPGGLSVGAGTAAADASSLLAVGNGEGVVAAILESRQLEVVVRGGVAEWDQVVASGWPGEYELVVAAVAVSGVGVKVAPLRQPVLLLPCGLGERLDASRATALSPSWTACTACPSEQFGLWVDSRPLTPSSPQSAAGATTTTPSVGGPTDGTSGGNVVPWPSASKLAWVREATMAAAQCRNCPDHTVCPGGAVMVPQPGYWHSAANSTAVHRCPKPQACRWPESDAPTAGTSISLGSFLRFSLSSNHVAAAQEPIAANTSTAAADRRSRALLQCQQQWYASRPAGWPTLTALQTAAVLAASNSSSTAVGTGGSAAAKDLASACFLWGLSEADPRSYMQLQCAPGYTGPLCGACQPGYFLTSDLSCAQCLSVSATAVLVTLAMLANTAFIMYTAVTNLSAGGTYAARHPNKGTLAAATGAQGKFISSPSCLNPEAGPREQARVYLLSSLMTPAVVIALVSALWVCRYLLGRRAVRPDGTRGPGGRRRGTPDADHSGARSSLKWRLRTLLWSRDRRQQARSVLRYGPSNVTGKAEQAVAVAVSPGLQRSLPGAADGARSLQPAAHSVRQLDVSEQVASAAAAAGLLGGAKLMHLPASAASLAPASSLMRQTAEGAALDDAGGAWPVVHVVALEHEGSPPALTCGGAGGNDDAASSDEEALPEPDVISPCDVYLIRKGATEAIVAAGMLPGAGGGGGGGEEGKERGGVGAAVRSLARSVTLDGMAAAATLGEVDVAIGLSSQLRMVVTTALTVLYAGWSQAALSVFACRTIDAPGGSGPFGELQRATWPYGYWMRDLTQQCYAGPHAAAYVPIGITAVLAICVTPPLASFIMLWRVRHKLDEPRTQAMYGFLYLRYKRRFFFWDPVVQLQTLALVAVDVFGRGLPVLQQSLLLLLGFNIIAAINMSTAPVRCRLLLVLEFLSLGVLSGTVTLGLFFVEPSQAPTGSHGAAIGVVILLLNSALLFAMLLMLLGNYRQAAAERCRVWWARLQRALRLAAADERAQRQQVLQQRQVGQGNGASRVSMEVSGKLGKLLEQPASTGGPVPDRPSAEGRGFFGVSSLIRGGHHSVELAGVCGASAPAAAVAPQLAGGVPLPQQDLRQQQQRTQAAREFRKLVSPAGGAAEQGGAGGVRRTIVLASERSREKGFCARQRITDKWKETEFLWEEMPPTAAAPWPGALFVAMWDDPRRWRGLPLLQRHRVLCLAASSGHLESVQVALRHCGVGPAAAAADDVAAAGVRGGSLEVCQLLKQHGFAPDRSNDQLAAALGQSGRVDLCQWALQHARGYYKDYCARVAQWAGWAGQEQLLEWCLSTYERGLWFRVVPGPAALGGQMGLLHQQLAERAAAAEQLSRAERFDLLRLAATGRCGLAELQHFCQATSALEVVCTYTVCELLVDTVYGASTEWRVKGTWLEAELAGGGLGAYAPQLQAQIYNIRWIKANKFVGVPDPAGRLAHLLDLLRRWMPSNYLGTVRWLALEAACLSGNAVAAAGMIAAPPESALQGVTYPPLSAEGIRMTLSRVLNSGRPLSGPTLDLLAGGGLIPADDAAALALGAAKYAPVAAYVLSRAAAAGGHGGGTAALPAGVPEACRRSFLRMCWHPALLSYGFERWQAMVGLLAVQQPGGGGGDAVLGPHEAASVLGQLACSGGVAHLEWLVGGLQACGVRLPQQLTQGQMECVVASGNAMTVQWLHGGGMLKAKPAQEPEAE